MTTTAAPATSTGLPPQRLARMYRAMAARYPTGSTTGRRYAARAARLEHAARQATTAPARA